MAEVIQTDLVLNIGPFKSQIDEATKGMDGYIEATDDATKGNKAFDNSLGSTASKLNVVKAATDGVAKAAAQVAAETQNAGKSGAQIGGLAGAWNSVKTGVTNAKNGVLDFFRGARDGVKQAIGEVGGFSGIFTQLSTNVKSAFGIVRKDTDSTGKSLAMLRAQIEALNKKKLNLTDPRQIASTNAQITKLTGEYNNLNRIGVKAGTQIGGSLKGITGQLQSAIPQVGGLGGSILGLLGPVGIAAGAIAGIGLAFAKNTDAGATFLDGISRTGGIVFDKLTGTVSRFFNSFTDGTGTVSKVFSAIADGATFALTKLNPIFILLEKIGVVDAFKEAAKDGQLLAQAYDDIDDAQIKNIKSNAVLDKQIRELEVKLRNRTTSEEERLKIGEQIGKLEEQRAADELKVLQQVTAAKRKEAELELRDNQEVNDTLRRELAEAEAAELAAAATSVERVERTQNRIDQIRKQGDDKRAAASAKAAAEEKKIAEGRLAVEQDLAKAEAALLGEREKAERAALDTRDARVQKAAGDAELLIQIEEAYNAELQAIRDKAAADAEQVANKQAQALQSAQLSSAQNRLDRLKQDQEIELGLAQAQGQDVQALLTKQYDERASLENDIQAARLDQLTTQYAEDYAALDGNLIAQYDRLAQFEVDKAMLLNESYATELDAKRQLLEQTIELDNAETELAQSRIDAVAVAGQIISQLAGDSKAAAAAGFAIQKAAAIAQVITTTNTAIAAAQAAAASVPAFFPITGLPNPLFPVAQGISVAQIARLKVGAAINLAQILAQSVSGFDEGGLIRSTDGPRIRKSGGDNVLITAKSDEIILTKAQQRRLKEETNPMIFGQIGVPGFAKPNHTYGQTFADPELQYRYISSMGAVNSYVEGRSGDTINNTTNHTAQLRWSDKRMVNTIDRGTKEAKRHTELLAMVAKGMNKGHNRRYRA
jgi:hypothetical protein